MEIKYKVKKKAGSLYDVIKITTIRGERTSAYESEPDVEKKEAVFKGSTAECYAYILLHEKGYVIYD